MGSDPAPPAPGAKKPVRIGKYEVLSHIATGGMGAIYRAFDTESGDHVALKILQPQMADKAAMAVRFRREYASASRLRHENIVALYDFGEAGKTLYFAMELVEGIDLHELVENEGTVDPEEARRIILQAARALRHAHQHGIIHRDIKPSNFLLAEKDGKRVVKLTDFGLARESSGDEFRVTRAGTTVGTIDYMSPEQAKDSGSADIRSDLYSLGATWYHLLAGHAPFPDGGLGERLIKLMSDPPPDPRESNPLVSSHTWAILEKLLSKSPDDRYQTPEELIADLLSLEGKATTKAKPRSGTKKKKRPAEETAAEPAATTADAPAKEAYIALAICAAVLLAVALFFLLPRGRKPLENDKPEDKPPVVIDDKDKEKDKDKNKEKDKDKNKEKDKDKDKEKPPDKKPKYPVLARLPAGRTVASMRAEIEKPWAGETPISQEVAKVRRVGGTGFHRTLADAIAALPAGKPGVVEIHDNGPLYEAGASSEGRALTLRAGKGFRPLVIWDLPATAGKGLVAFLDCRGPLNIEGLEIAWRWPDSLAAEATLFRVAGGDLRLTKCTFSAAGKPRSPVWLALLESAKEGAKCRVDRCLSRGQGLAGLDVSAPAAEILIDGSLLAGHGPLVRIRAGDTLTRLRVVASTLSASSRLLELAPLGEAKRPALNVMAWDSILARTGGIGGEMLAITGGAGPEGVEWRPVAALFAGWGTLLSAGGTSVTSLDAWRKRWGGRDGDELHRAPWPEAPGDEPATRPATDFKPTGAVAFGSTADPDRPLGCDPASLPPCRDDWMRLALDPLLIPPEGVIADRDLPAIPRPGDKLYHGERIDLGKVADLGRHLEAAQAKWKFGPRVVLHLVGKGEKATSPIRVKGSTLVLHFQEAEDKKDGPLSLKAGFAATAGPLIEVEGGGLEIIGGALRCPDSSGIKLTQLVRVSGGDVRMYRTRLEGPRLALPEGYRAALSVRGSGDSAPDKARVVALNECLIVSSQAGIETDGPGLRLLLRQCLAVTGTDVLAVMPGQGCQGRPNVQVLLESCSLAAKRAVLLLGDTGDEGPASPVQVRSRDCAFLNPFAGKPNRAGLLLYEGDALSRGLLVWQGERDAFDPRLHFGAAPASEGPPEAKEPLAVWTRMWGSPGRSSPRPDLPTTLPYLGAKAWQLEQLILPASVKNPPGAILSRLGIVPRKRP